MQALERVGLKERVHHMPNQLSGGQQQRVSIARALASEPSVILADEPTGALDSGTGKEILAFFKELHREGNTIVLITHDNGIAAQAPRVLRQRFFVGQPLRRSIAAQAPRVLRLSDGRLVDDCSGRQFRERLRALETEEAQA